MITASTESGVLGTISLDDGRLTASTPALQDIADTAVRHTGSAAAAYRRLANHSNGYVHYSADTGTAAAVKSTAAGAAGHFQAEGYYNSASSIGVASASAARARLTVAQLADLMKVGPHGYTHGWHFVGSAEVGAEVSHPDFGTGRIFAHTEDAVHVRFSKGDGGEDRAFPRATHNVAGKIPAKGMLEPASSGDLKRAIANTNRQSKVYTDAQVGALQSQISSLAAEMHAEAHRDAKVALGIRITAIGAAAALAFVTGHEEMSIAVVGAMFLDRIPEIIKEVAEYLRAKAVHTGKPAVRAPVKRKPKDTKMTRRKKMKIKSASSAAEQLADLFSSRLAAHGVDEDVADRVSAALVTAAAAGGFPGDDSFMSNDQALAIVNGKTPVTMKASDLSAWLKTE